MGGCGICTSAGVASARIIFAVFVIFQVADGLITYSAVSLFGSEAEGNPLIATWIDLAGPEAAIAGAKLLACGCGALLYALGVRRTLAALTGMYLFVAVGPWLHVLSTTLE